jgi:opacity protein-like surface antigen
MRKLTFLLFCTLAAPLAYSAEGDRSLAMSLGGFSGNDTSGIAIGFYSLRPKSIGWYMNGTLSSRVDTDGDDDNFRPVPGDIRVDGDTESMTLNAGFTFAVGPVAPYVGVGISQISEYGLYRAPSAAFWYEEKDDTKGNFNVGILLSLHRRLGLDLGVNSANEEIAFGFKWAFQ